MSFSENTSNSKPFYFGTTDLRCMQKVNFRTTRTVLSTLRTPERQYWTLTHRWIYYDGAYFELFFDPHTGFPAKYQFCSYQREAKPAGFSKLPLDCLCKCASYYNKRFIANYNMWTHNCHHYANKIAYLLCNYSHCPEWCV